MHEEKDSLALTKKEILPFSISSILVGCLAALVICLYIFLFGKIIEWSVFMYAKAAENIGFAFLQLFVVLSIALLSFLIITRIPFLIGSGIPQAVGILHGKFTKNKIIYIPLVFFITLFSIFCGLPYGYEGPIVFIGSLTGNKSAQLLKRNAEDTALLSQAGFGAAFCAVFNAPIAALTFTLEEGTEKLSTKFLISTGLAIAVSALIRRAILGANPIFSFIVLPADVNFPIYVGLFFLAVITGVLAPLFNKVLLKARKIPQKVNKKWLLPLYLVPFLLAFGLSYLNKNLLYGGEGIIHILAYPGSISGLVVLGLWAVRFVLLALTMMGRTSGGLFVPTLAQGAMTGYLIAQLGLLFGMNPELVSLFVAVGMLGYFVAMTKAPLTACILLFELTGAIRGIIPVMFAVVVSFIVSEFISKKCLYSDILDDMLASSYELSTSGDKLVESNDKISEEKSE